TLADWQWLNENRDAALQTFMPSPQRYETIVTYRSFRDSYQDVKERYFSISYAGGDGPDRSLLKATVVIPTGCSIQQQILELHMRNRRAGIEELLPRVNVRRVLLDEKQCPAIRARVDALSDSTILLPEQSKFVLHPFLHDFSIEMPMLSLHATLTDEANPL